MDQEIMEFGQTEETSQVYRVIKSFWMPVCFGPLQEVRPGMTVRLGERLGAEMFGCGRVSPVTLSEYFEVIYPIRFVEDGAWVDLAPGDVVKMTPEEALPLLRERKIKERRNYDASQSE